MWVNKNRIKHSYMLNTKKTEVVLVTGGVGFIGSSVVKNLINNYNLKVIVVDNLSVGKLENLGEYQEKILFHNIDIRSKNDLEAIIAKCDYVIHLAANVSIQKSIEDPLESASTNIFGFLNILDLCQKYQIKKLVYASSAAVYGDSSQELSEDLPLNPISPYGFEKMANEYYAAFYQQYYGLNSVGLRYFNVYGANNNKNSSYAGVIKIFADAIKNNEEMNIYGDGLQTRDFIFVEDIASITIKSLLNEMNGIYNLATGSNISIIQLAEIMQKIANKSVKINFLPSKESDILISHANIDKIKLKIKDFSTTEISSGLSQIYK